MRSQPNLRKAMRSTIRGMELRRKAKSQVEELQALMDEGVPVCKVCGSLPEECECYQGTVNP